MHFRRILSRKYSGFYTAANEGAGENVKDGMIAPDSKNGLLFGFTSDRFETFSYLWKTGNCIWISMIKSTKENQGYFRKLVDISASTGWGI